MYAFAVLSLIPFLVFSSGCQKKNSTPESSLPRAVAGNGASTQLPLLSTETFPLFLRHDVNGQAACLVLPSIGASGNSDYQASFGLTGVQVGPSERIAAVADWNRDGVPDLLLQRFESVAGDVGAAGSTLRFLLAGDRTGGRWVGASAGSLMGDEHVVGMMDLTGDGVAEIVTRAHDPGKTGRLIVRRLSGATFVEAAELASNNFSPVEWRAAGVGKHLGSSYVVFHNRKSGTVALWFINTALQIGARYELADSSGTKFEANPQEFDLIGPALLSGAGKGVLLFRGLKTGAIHAWKMNSAQGVESTVTFPALPHTLIEETGEPDYRHIRRQFAYPNIGVPAGHRWTEPFPDTLDLAERAQLALRAMANFVDPENENNMYWITNLLASTPWALAGENPQMNAKFLEAMALLRIMTGENVNPSLDLDRALWIAFARDLTRQGNYMLPSREHADGQYDVHIRDTGVSHKYEFLPQGRYLAAFANYTTLGQVEPLPRAEYGDLLVTGLNGIAQKSDPRFYEYFYRESYLTGPQRLRQIEGKKVPWNDVTMSAAAPKSIAFFQIADHSPRTIQGPAEYFRKFGFPLAGAIAEKSAAWIWHGESRMFDAQGNFHPVGPDETKCLGGLQQDGSCPGGIVGAPHWAMRSKALNAMLTAGLATGNAGLVQYATGAFRKGIEDPSSRASIGYFPEYMAVGNHEHQHIEADQVADVLDFFVKTGDWDAADSVLRNQFAEGQMDEQKTAMMAKFRQDMASADGGAIHFDHSISPITNGGKCRVSSIPPETGKERSLRCLRGEDVVQKSLGTWSSYAAPNAWGYFRRNTSGGITSGRFGAMHCCLANAARTLYVVWKNMYEERAGVNRFHLQINRATRYLRMYSWLPYHGRVDVRAGADAPARNAVEVRAPSWIPTQNTQVLIKDAQTGASKYFEWNGRYVRFNLSPGEQVSIQFPVSDRIVPISIDTPDQRNKPFKFRFRGTQVVAVDPPGYEAIQVGGQTRWTGVPFYTRFADSIERANVFTVEGNWKPKSPGALLRPMQRYVHPTD